MRRLVVALCVTGAVTFVGRARAEEKAAGVTVLPVNGAFFKIAPEEKRGQLAVGWLRGLLRVHASASVPLDEDTRRAAFTEDKGLAPGFNAAVSIMASGVAYKAGQIALSDSISKARLCQEYYKDNPPVAGAPIPACDGDDYEKWLAAKGASLIARYGIPASAFATEKFASYLEGGLDLKVAYDRIGAYTPNVAADKVNVTKSDVRVGVVGRLYLAPWVAFTVRAGAEFNKSARTGTFRRCVGLASTDPNVTGQACDDKAIVLRKDLPLETSLYHEYAATIIMPVEVSKTTPGLEFAMRFDALDAVRWRHMTATAFVSPVSEPVITKFGVGIEWSTALEDDPAGSFKRGTRRIAPFLVVGAAF